MSTRKPQTQRNENPVYPASRRTAVGLAITDIILEVFRINGVFIAAGERLTNDLGLTSARWQVMGVLELIPAATVSQIARRQGLQRQSVQRLVDLLVAERLVELIDNPDHRRAKFVRMTEHGQDVYQKLYRRQVRWVNALGERLGRHDIGAACDALRALRVLIEDFPQALTISMQEDDATDAASAKPPRARKSTPDRATG